MLLLVKFLASFGYDTYPLTLPWKDCFGDGETHQIKVLLLLKMKELMSCSGFCSKCSLEIKRAVHVIYCSIRDETIGWCISISDPTSLGALSEDNPKMPSERRGNRRIINTNSRFKRRINMRAIRKTQTSLKIIQNKISNEQFLQTDPNNGITRGWHREVYQISRWICVSKGIKNEIQQLMEKKIVQRKIQPGTTRKRK